MTSLSSCSMCNKPFNIQDIPTISSSLFVTPCFHIFHINCMKKWVVKAENLCPNKCTQKVYKHQAGRSVKDIWTFFLQSLHKSPTIVLEHLQNKDQQNDSCAFCHVEHPIIALWFDPSKQTLTHPSCNKNESNVYLHDVVAVVKKIAEQDSEIRKHFTPTPPTDFQRFRYNYPLLFRVTMISVFSISAFVFNRHQYGDQSWVLYALSLPVVIALYLTHQVALLMIAILNLQKHFF